MAAWNPWAALRALEEISVVFRRLPRGMRGCIGQRGVSAVIVIDDRLGQLERNAVLAHELVHYERNGGAWHAGQPPTWAAVVARDEAAVDDEVARRLIPPDELARYVDGRVDLGDAVMPWEIADEFGVPERIAARLQP